MNILITGGCGFVGSNLSIELKNQGHQITCFDNLSRRGSELILFRILEHGCNFIHGDIRNTEDLLKLKDYFDLMIECSAEPSVLSGSKGSDAYYLINNNLIGLINCLEYCRIHKVPIIFLSTSRVYPYDKLDSLQYLEEETRFEVADNQEYVSKNGVSVDFPLNGIRSLYGATKLSAEFILKEYSINYNIPSIINRFGVIAGPWQLGKVDQGVFTYWLANHYFKKDLKYIGYGGQGKQVRDLLHIDDLLDLIKTQIGQIAKYRGEIFNAGGSSFSSLSLLETTRLCQEITGHDVNVYSEPENRHADMIWFKSDNKLTEKEFQWSPKKDARIILTDIFNWLKNNESTFSKIFNS
jgi:CDP-paratose 2-epimerase